MRQSRLIGALQPQAPPTLMGGRRNVPRAGSASRSCRARHARRASPPVLGAPTASINLPARPAADEVGRETAGDHQPDFTGRALGEIHAASLGNRGDGLPGPVCIEPISTRLRRVVKPRSSSASRVRMGQCGRRVVHRAKHTGAYGGLRRPKAKASSAGEPYSCESCGWRTPARPPAAHGHEQRQQVFGGRVHVGMRRLAFPVEQGFHVPGRDPLAHQSRNSRPSGIGASGWPSRRARRGCGRSRRNRSPARPRRPTRPAPARPVMAGGIRVGPDRQGHHRDPPACGYMRQAGPTPWSRPWPSRTLTAGPRPRSAPMSPAGTGSPGAG